MPMSQNKTQPIKYILRIIYGSLFVISGATHFIFPEFYERLVPANFPSPALLIILTGVAEIVLGALLIWPPTARLASWGLIGLLVAMFPVFIHMATHPEQFPQFAPLGLWLRLPLQTLLISLAYWLGRPLTPANASMKSYP
jgi:uncharacterized membrane protein